MMFKLKIMITRQGSSSTVANPRLRDVLNENLKHGEPIPFSSWKEAWKEKYSSQSSENLDGTFF